MLPSRQVTAIDESKLILRSLALGLPPGFRTATHRHPWGQLVYAQQGALCVHAGPQQWIVPPQRALWVPCNYEHQVEAIGRTAMRTLYLRPDHCASLPPSCNVLAVSKLVREIILRIVETGMIDEGVGAHQRLAQVLLDQLEAADVTPLQLPWPTDPRARRVAERVLAQVGWDQTLDDIIVGSGASRRTIERCFVVETGLPLGRWRQQARLLQAMRRLAEGLSVTEVAFEVGYESSSAFVSMFRNQLGVTPGRMFPA